MKNYKNRDYSKNKNRIKHKNSKKQINIKKKKIEKTHYHIKLVLAIPYIGTMAFSTLLLHDLLYS